MKIGDIIDQKNIPTENSEGEGAIVVQNPSQVSLLTLSDDEVVEIIRPEANLEKWQAFIFPHPKAQNLTEERVMKYPVELPDGRNVEAQIKITPAVGHRCATSSSYDVYLAILSIWDNRGMPDEPFFTSLREIILAMGLSDTGKNYSRVLKEIEVLYHTNISWVFSFSGKDKHESGRNRRILTVFDYETISERADLTTKTDQVLKLQLHDSIRANHRRSNTKPIIWTERKKLTSSVAKTFLSTIDPILYHRERYERTGKGLVEDMLLTPGRYKYKSQRLGVLKRIQEQVDGALLSCLHTVNINISLTADETDYKIIATRGDSRKRAEIKGLPVYPRSKAEQDHLLEKIVTAVGTSDFNNKTYRRCVMHYSTNHIDRAIGEFKEAKEHLVGKDAVEKQKYFTAIMHRIAHDLGLEWFKDCGDVCKYRKQNRLL
jgi:hypothetical protein